MSLSGGERQCITLACAFLKDAPILILDEPTSSVDSETEAAIINAMERLISANDVHYCASDVGVERLRRTFADYARLPRRGIG
jgi:ABC-type bacteriocin/lantibiotic exporter with double-glycine peptidase domain